MKQNLKFNKKICLIWAWQWLILKNHWHTLFRRFIDQDVEAEGQVHLLNYAFLYRLHVIRLTLTGISRSVIPVNDCRQ